MSYNSFMMGGFNKNPNDQQSNQNMLPNNPQQNQGTQNFMGSMQGNSLMNFGIGGHQLNPTSFEPSESYNYGSMGQSSIYQDHLKKLKEKFNEIKDEIIKMDKNTELFKNHQLPLARVKKIMKSDEDVRMISAEAPVLFAKACEIFIVELTHRAWFHTEESKRRTLQKIDIANCIAHTDIFDFLLDIIPKEEYKTAQPPRKPNDNFANAFQQLAAAGQGSNLMMGNKNPSNSSNFNPMMNQNFLNMGNLMNANSNNPQNQGTGQQSPMPNNNPGYPGFVNFMNPNNLPYVGIKEENKNTPVNNQNQQKVNNNNNPNK